jgi:hypothetical protein
MNVLKAIARVALSRKEKNVVRTVLMALSLFLTGCAAQKSAMLSQ